MSAKYPPQTRSSALERARAKADSRASNGVGWCLRECVVNIYQIPPQWRFAGDGRPTAYNYWLSAVERGRVVHTSNPMDIPAGAMAFMAGGHAGHVFIGAGGGYAYSTDRPTNGHWGHVSIRSIERAWAHTLVGYIDVTGDGYTLSDRPVVTDVTKVTEFWEVNVSPGSTLNGRLSPVTGRVVAHRKPGTRIRTQWSKTVWGTRWVCTRYGVWHSTRYLRKVTK